MFICPPTCPPAPGTTVVTTGRTDNTRGQMAVVVASKIRKKMLNEVTGEDDQEKGVKLTLRNSVTVQS